MLEKKLNSLKQNNNMEEVKQARVLYFLTGVFIALKLTE
jgi:hypothetical protein